MLSCVATAGQRALWRLAASVVTDAPPRRALSAAQADKVFRMNAATGEWTVYATARGNRPKQTVHAVPKQYAAQFSAHDASCPFCRGNEALTPPAILELPGPEGGWGLRVIANKYPAVTPFIPGSEPARDVHDCAQFGDASTVNNEVPAVGHHEVLIESPVHNHLAATGTGEQLSLLVRAWVSRTCTISQDTRIRQILCFKNQGGAAGASIVHPHSQIVALPLIPRLVETQLKHARDYYVKHGASVFKMMLREELAAGARVIESNSHFAAFVPYAAICPFETWILPLRQQAHMHLMTAAEEDCFTEILHRILRRLHFTLGEPNYNMIIRSAPVPDRPRTAAYNNDAFFSWHCRIFPRLGAGAMAGFEFGSGIFSNSNAPEVDAQKLRAVTLSP